MVKNKQTEQLNTQEESEVKSEPEELTAEQAAEVSDAENTPETPTEGQEGGEVSEKNEPLKHFEGRTVEPPKKSRFGWLSYVLLAVAVGLGLWAMFGIAQDMGETKSFASVIAGSDWRFALIFLAVLLVILTCDCMKYAVIMKTTTGKFNLRSSIKVEFMGRFYDNVTPFAVGGQPMQIYYLHKKGYSGGVSSAVILIKYFTQMICMCSVSLILMACCTGVLNLIHGDYAVMRTVIMVCAWIGVFVNLALPIMVLMFVIFPKFSQKIATFVIFLGFKLKIVKDREKAMTKALNTVNEFRTSFKIMSHKPLNFIALIALCVAEVFLRYALPFFVMMIFAHDNVGFADIITVTALNVYATQSVTIAPTPGNSGFIESTGVIAFSAFVTGSVLSWSVFAWRLSVYYIYIIVGLGILIFDVIRKIVRRRIQKKKEQENL